MRTTRKPFYDLEFIEKRLKMWLDAEAALATSQSYKVGTRELRRADLPEVREQIEFWENKYNKATNELDGTSGGGRRTVRIVPRDL